MSGPFASTLIVLPLVILGLWAVGRWARAGGPLESPARWTFTTAALVAMVLAVLARRSIGLNADSVALDPLLAASLLALLVLWLVTLMPTLMDRAAGVAGSRPSWPFFLLPLTVYIAILPWSAGQREPDGDEPYFLLIAHSLTHDLDTDLADNYADRDSLSFMSRALEPSWADPPPRDGRIYSRQSPLLPLILVPGYLLAGRWGAMMTMAAISAVVAWLALALYLRQWGGEVRRESVAVWALLSLTPPLLLYSHQIWVEVPAAALVLLGLIKIRDLSEPEGRSGRDWLVLVFPLLLLPLLKLRFAVLSVSLLGLAWWRGGRSRKILARGGLAVGVALGSILAYNFVVFGSPFKDHTLGQLLKIQGRSPIDYGLGVAGLFFDSAFGLVSSNPLWLLLLPAVALAIRVRHSALVDVLICAVPYLAMVSPRREWYGAWSPPFRFGIVLLPLLGLLLVPLLARRRAAGSRALMTALALMALVLTLLWVVVPGWTYNLAVGTNHLIDHLSSRLAADVGRLFPSMVRPRAATLWFPGCVLPIAILLWWWPRRWPRHASAWATAVLLTLVAAVPMVATRLASGWVEIEDRQVRKSGGGLYPGPWTPFRPQYRGGWAIGAGESVRLPVIPGGDRASIRLDVRSIERASGVLKLEAMADGERLAPLEVDTRAGWQSLSIEGVDWPAGADLVVTYPTEDGAGEGGRVVLDRVRFIWQ